MSKDMKSDILGVVEAKRAIYYLTADYEEGGMGHSVGTVYKVSASRDEGEIPEMVLSSNETLSKLWLSPEGSLWVASATGRIATTAPVPGSAAGTGDGRDYSSTAGLSWVVQSLPPVRSTGIPPNVTALWGIDDDNVIVGTYGGHIYQWDGKSWLQTHEGPGKGDGTITAFDGPAADDVFAAGRQGTLLHHDGKSWRPIDIPGEPNGRENFTGVQIVGADEVLISASGTQGRLLHGSSAAGLTELGRYDIELIGMALLDDRVIFATGNGCAELVGREVKVIKNTFDTVAVFAGRGRVFFIEPEQPVPGYVEYDPREGENAWWGMEF